MKLGGSGSFRVSVGIKTSFSYTNLIWARFGGIGSSRNYAPGIRGHSIGLLVSNFRNDNNKYMLYLNGAISINRSINLIIDYFKYRLIEILLRLFVAACCLVQLLFSSPGTGAFLILQVLFRRWESATVFPALYIPDGYWRLLVWPFVIFTIRHSDTDPLHHAILQPRIYRTIIFWTLQHSAHSTRIPLKVSLFQLALLRLPPLY